MKLAFSTGSLSLGDLGSGLASGRRHGYEAVDIGGALLSEVVAKPSECRRVCEKAGVGICCLTSGAEFIGSEEIDERSAETIGKLIDAAGEMGCPWVVVGANTISIGRSAVTAMLGDWLGRLGDWAAKCGVGVLLGNQKTFGASSDIWAVLDRLRHPAIACCWDVLTAATMGERPGVSVPTLNSRIRLVRVGDAKIADGAVSACKLGEGDVAVEQFIKRLRGIGYGGYAIVNSAGNEDLPTDSAEKLQKWWTPPVGKIKHPPAASAAGG
jgi:sugar phosphate isomerase/epimerase